MGNKKDSLGDRMKENYENRNKYRLIRRVPVIIRVDGKAFHTYTRGFNRPFDRVLSNAMDRTMKSLCSSIQGCVFGYTQSDEITIVMHDYESLNSCAWFDNEVQKICSISASMATAFFNQAFKDEAEKFHQKVHFAAIEETSLKDEYFIDDIETAKKLDEKYLSRISVPAMFDARCFNIPIAEVTNCVLWRQQDATRNSIEMAGRYYFSHSELHKKNSSNIQDMLMEKFGVNWNDYPVRYKRGCACYKRWVGEKPLGKSEWYVDYDMPIISKNRDYIEQYILPKE